MPGRPARRRGTTGGALHERFAVAQQTMSRHLRVLREAGVVPVRTQARQRWYALEPDALAAVDAWLRRYRTFWSARLDALAAEVERGPS